MKNNKTISYELLNGVSHKEFKNIIFVHGSGGNKNFLKALAKVLDNDYNCYLIDLPGHGDSKDMNYSFENYVDTVCRLIEELNLTNVTVVGHSLGGSIALGVGVRNLPNVEGVVSMSGAASFPKLDKEFMSKIHNGEVDKDYMVSASGNMDNVDVLESLSNLESDDVLVKDFLIDEALNIEADLDKIKVKTLVIVGGDDILALPEYSELIADKIPNCELEIIPGYMHMLPLANKYVVATLINMHIRKL